MITFRLCLSICLFVYSFHEYFGGLACGANEKSTERRALASCESCLCFISGAPEQIWRLWAGSCSHSLTRALPLRFSGGDKAAAKGLSVLTHRLPFGDGPQPLNALWPWAVLPLFKTSWVDINRKTASGNCRIVQGAHVPALWWPRGAGWGRGGRAKRAGIYVYI